MVLAVARRSMLKIVMRMMARTFVASRGTNSGSVTSINIVQSISCLLDRITHQWTSHATYSAAATAEF